MQAISLLCLFVALGFAQPNTFVTDFGDVIAGESLKLTWTNQSAGQVSIWLMPNVDGEYTPFAYRISVGAENIDNTGSANVSIPTAPTVNTNSTQLYFFEIENPAQYDSNNQSDSPADHSDTNYSADFAIQAPRILEKKGPTLSKSAIAGIAVGGAVCLFLAGFAFWCRLNREKLRNAEETADVSYRPDKSMFQTRTSELPRTPTTPPKRISFSDSSSGSPTTLEASPTSMAEILDEDPSHGPPCRSWVPNRSEDHRTGHDPLC